MPTKQELLVHLDHLRSLVASQESDADAQRCYASRRYLPWQDDDHSLRQLRRIEEKVNEVLARPGTSCQFKEGDGTAIARFIVSTGHEARGKANQYLGELFAGSTELSICDPYILQPYSGVPAKDYVNTLFGVLPTRLKTLELFVKPRQRNREVADELTRLCGERGVRMTVQKTHLLHDRVWISDWEHAYTVGTSFNGLGNRCAFILRLPDDDRRAFVRELASIRATATRSKSA